MSFEHLGHQAIHRPADGRDLLQDRGAVTALLKRRLQRIRLPLDAPDARQQLLLFLDRVWH